METVNESLRQSVRTEHYRLHCAETWPDGPYKEAVLAAVRCALERLQGAGVEPFDPTACMVCANRRTRPRVLVFPATPSNSFVTMRPAA